MPILDSLLWGQRPADEQYNQFGMTEDEWACMRKVFTGLLLAFFLVYCFWPSKLAKQGPGKAVNKSSGEELEPEADK
jgi:hypothetical protein